MSKPHFDDEWYEERGREREREQERRERAINKRKSREQLYNLNEENDNGKKRRFSRRRNARKHG